MRLFFFGVAFFLVPYALLANTAVDSLLTVYSSTYDSKIKANTAYKIARYYKRKNTDSSILYIDSAFFYASDSALIGDIYRLKADVFILLGEIGNSIEYLDSSLLYLKNDTNAIVDVVITKGEIYRKSGKYIESEKNYKSLLSIFPMDSLISAKVYLGLGSMEKRRGNYAKAINLQFKALEIFSAKKDTNRLASSYNQIAILFKVMQDYEKAIEYYNFAIEINSRDSNTKFLSYNYNNLGNVYMQLKEYDSSIFYHKKSLEIKKKIKDVNSLGSSFLNLGEVYTYKGEFQNAYECLKIAESYANDLNNEISLSYAYLYLGKLFFYQKDLQKAKKYLIKSMKISQNKSLKINISEGAELLYQIYYLNDKYEQALKMRNLHFKMKENILSEENKRAIISNQYRMIAKSDSTANALELELQQQKLKAKNTELEENERKLTYLSIAILLFLGLIVFIYSRLRVIRNQKEIIDGAFIQLEEKSNEIQDSIEYAKRIQKGISPSLELIRDFFPESFVFYQPKSVVAGDFFWVKKINNNLLFAVGDCTGHGVPGAMVSVLCQSILNRVVADFKFFDPSKILDEARKLIVEHLDYGNEVIHDGMDIALCSFDTSTSKMQFSGANNPLWVVRNNELLEFKGDHQPVGYFQKSKNFTNNTLQVKKGDMVFVFSDGFSDQFGGEKGKKYKLGNFKKFILSINENNFPSYSTELEREFNQWKGDNEQVDDVCILGIKF